MIENGLSGKMREAKMASRSYAPTRDNSGISNQKMPKVVRVSKGSSGKRLIPPPGGQGGRGDISPMRNASAKSIRPLGASNLNTIPDAPK